MSDTTDDMEENALRNLAECGCERGEFCDGGKCCSDRNGLWREQREKMDGYRRARDRKFAAPIVDVKPRRKQVTTENKKKELGPCDCVTPLFRGSYVTLFEPRAPDATKPNENKQYGVEMWFRVAEVCDERLKDQPIVKIDDLVKAANAAAAEKWGVDPNKWPKGLKNPIKKGESLTGKNGTLAGGIVVRTNRKESFGRPVVVDQNVKDIIDKDSVYSGAYFIAKVHAYAWEHPTGGKGVSFTLDMVQLHHDGEPLGNRLEAADAFASIPVPGGAPAGAGAQPAQPAAAGGVFGDLG